MLTHLSSHVLGVGGLIGPASLGGRWRERCFVLLGLSGSPKPHCKELLKVGLGRVAGDKQHDQESGAEWCLLIWLGRSHVYLNSC